jgi:hypothetical protein
LRFSWITDTLVARIFRFLAKNIVDEPDETALAAVGGTKAMTGLYDFLGRLDRGRITEQEIRAEVFALGNRHRGCVLEGARAEAQAPNLPLRRAVLLQAVIRRQSR